jgi:Ca-activated chloride channel family protein
MAIPLSTVRAVAFRCAAALLLPFLLLAGASARAQTSEAAPEGGLFFKTEKPGVYYEAPVLRTDVQMAIDGTIARVTLRQHFINPSNAWLEGVYVFPLPEQSAVDHLVMQIGVRRIVGQIKERQEAEAVYKAAAEAGQQASLVSSERPNIFTSSVANVGPGQEITVEIAYQDSVAVAAGRYSLRFPMVVGPRYIPGGGIGLVSAQSNAGTGWAPDTDRVPDASRITPPVLHPDQGKINPVSLSIDFDPGFPTESVSSLYHPVIVTPVDGERATITLAAGDVPADRDFVLEWAAKPEAAPQTSLFAEERNGDVYLYAMMTPPAFAAPAATHRPRDVVFVIDTSGSMGGTSIDQAKKALSLALDRLSPGDRFNVIRFSDTTSALFDDLRPWNTETLRDAQRAVSALEADGGTEMQPALRLALSGTTPEGRLKQVVFLTDAAVGNEAELFDDIAQRLGNTRLFTVGIGSAPNSYFMRKAAELGRGSFTYIGDIGEVGQRMDELLRRLERPALTDIAVRWPDSLTTTEMYPATVPDLYYGQPVTFALRLPGTSLDQLSGALAIEGRQGDRTWRRSIDLAHVRPGAGVAALWARAKLAAIEDGQWRGADPAAVKTEATRLALRYGLVSAYTSLVAVAEEIVRPQAETLTTAAMPTNLPHGWDYEKVFGGEQEDAPATPRPAPSQLMREINFNGSASPLDSLGLPRTATPAMLHLLIGLCLLAAAIVAAVTAMRSPLPQSRERGTRWGGAEIG